MAKKRITVTVDEDVANFLYSAANTSAVACDAVREHRARQLEKELEAAYSEDAEATAELASEWQHVP